MDQTQVTTQLMWNLYLYVYLSLFDCLNCCCPCWQSCCYFQVPGKPVIEVTREKTTARLQWSLDEKNGKILVYEVRYYSVDSGSELLVNSTFMNITITGLDPESDYHFDVSNNMHLWKNNCLCGSVLSIICVVWIRSGPGDSLYLVIVFVIKIMWWQSACSTRIDLDIGANAKMN